MFWQQQQHLNFVIMDPKHLSKSELLFELVCRDITPRITEVSRRVQLDIALRDPKIKIELFNVDWKITEDEINASLVSIAEILEANTQGIGVELQEQLKSRFMHLDNRITLIKSLAERDDKAHIVSMLEAELKILDGAALLAFDVDSENNDSASNRSVGSDANINVSTGNRSKIPVFKWNLKFNGHADKVGILEFLEQVEECKESRGVSDDELFVGATELMSGSAITWLRNQRNKVKNWAELVKALKKEFLPQDFEYQLHKEVQDRMQGLNENVMSFIMVVESLYYKIDKNTSEKIIVDQIVRNLNPFFSMHIALDDYADLEKLKDRCRRVQELKLKNDKYAPAVRSVKRTFAVNSDSRSIDSGTLSEGLHSEPEYFVESVSGVRAASVNRDIPVDSGGLLCWNCNKRGHRFLNCEMQRNIFCYGCGTKNVYKNQCSRCSSAVTSVNNVNSENSNEVVSTRGTSNLDVSNRPFEAAFGTLSLRGRNFSRGRGRGAYNSSPTQRKN